MKFKVKCYFFLRMYKFTRAGVDSTVLVINSKLTTNLFFGFPKSPGLVYRMLRYMCT